jgi:hypothetical protein
MCFAYRRYAECVLRTVLASGRLLQVPPRTYAMPRLKLDPTRARNLSHDYAKWLLQERRERTPASGKLFARLHCPGGRRFHGFNEAEVCKIIGGDFYDQSR